MSDQDFRVLAKILIKEQTTMTLATVRGTSSWASPVYYTTYRSSFYFFSDPESRHILDSLEDVKVAAAIYPPAFSWREIRGIQMSGRVRQVSAGLEAMQVIRVYFKKFPFIDEFFDSGKSLSLESFRNHFGVRLYRFKPDLIYYLDNKVRFGFRTEVKI